MTGPLHPPHPVIVQAGAGTRWQPSGRGRARGPCDGPGSHAGQPRTGAEKRQVVPCVRVLVARAGW